MKIRATFQRGECARKKFFKSMCVKSRPIKTDSLAKCSMVRFIAICRKDYTILLACSSLVATCGMILYFLIGLGYTFCVVMTVFVMEDHPKIVKICLLVNLGLGATRFFILVCSIAMGLMTGTNQVKIEIGGILERFWNGMILNKRF